MRIARLDIKPLPARHRLSLRPPRIRHRRLRHRPAQHQRRDTRQEGVRPAHQHNRMDGQLGALRARLPYQPGRPQLHRRRNRQRGHHCGSEHQRPIPLRRRPQTLHPQRRHQHRTAPAGHPQRPAPSRRWIAYLHPRRLSPARRRGQIIIRHPHRQRPARAGQTASAAIPAKPAQRRQGHLHQPQRWLARGRSHPLRRRGLRHRRWRRNHLWQHAVALHHQPQRRQASGRRPPQARTAGHGG